MNKRILALLVVLAAIVAILAAVHLNTRTPEIEGAILVNGKPCDISKLQLQTVQGTLVNGKGEQNEINAQGINLGALWEKPFLSVTVKAADEYSATVGYEEIENAYLILNDDGSVRLAVFGDANSKRSVRNVSSIEFAE